MHARLPDGDKCGYARVFWKKRTKALFTLLIRVPAWSVPLDPGLVWSFVCTCICHHTCVLHQQIIYLVLLLIPLLPFQISDRLKIDFCYLKRPVSSGHVVSSSLIYVCLHCATTTYSQMTHSFGFSGMTEVRGQRTVLAS